MKKTLKFPILKKHMSLSEYVPSEAEIHSACLSYRHDFGLLDTVERKHLADDAREWLEAWGKTLPCFKQDWSHDDI